MPGRPNTERKREPHEAPKATKMSRMGTVIRCNKCKGVGHNRLSCDRRNGIVVGSGATSSAYGAPKPLSVAAPQPRSSTAPKPPCTASFQPRSGTQQSSNNTKRNLPISIASQDSGIINTVKKVMYHFRFLFEIKSVCLPFFFGCLAGKNSWSCTDQGQGKGEYYFIRDCYYRHACTHSKFHCNL